MKDNHNQKTSCQPVMQDSTVCNRTQSFSKQALHTTKHNTQV